MKQPIDMGLTEEDRKHEAMEAEKPSKPPRYPYGLLIRLESDQIEALGLDEMPDIGAEVNLCGAGCVESLNMGYNGEGPTMSIQIKALAVEISDDDEKGEKEEKKEKPSNIMDTVERY